MIEWIIWIVSFLSLYLGIFWLHVVNMKEAPKKENTYFPKVSVVVPARNEEKGLPKTINSLVKLNWPKDKLEILIVDHDSIDKTAQVAKELINTYPGFDIRLIHRDHEPWHIKSHSFNEGLKNATGEFVACVDADTVVQGNCFSEMIPEFQEEKVGAVISTIKVTDPKNIYEKIQHLEYLFATFARSLMSKIDTLHVTPGALSIYRKRLFDELGPFDENNVTEDLEMAMRLRYHGYKVRLAIESVTYTKVPDAFCILWSQRVRWFRGFIYNNIKYKKMMMSKEHGMMGRFQYPLNFISITTIIVMFTLLSYEAVRRIIQNIVKFSTIGWEFFAFQMPTIKQMILNLNINIVFPIAISFLIALFIYHLSHKRLNERWRYPTALLAYLTVYPLLRSMHWMTAIYKETFKLKKKW